MLSWVNIYVDPVRVGQQYFLSTIFRPSTCFMV